MIPKEILKKVRQIQIKSNRIVNDIFAGEYHSAFKGRGIEFDGVREYQFGDEIRTIDWNVTARTGVPHVKYFVEERELTVMLVVDVSSSEMFGTTDQLKKDLMAEFCAIISFAAIENNDKIGLIMFSDKIEKFIPPKKGKKHILRVIRELLYFKPENSATNLNVALEHLNKILKRKAVVFMVSDFIIDNLQEKKLALTNKRHDLIAIKISDPTEFNMPDIGFIELEDSETGEIILVNTSDLNLRKNYNKMNKSDLNNLEKTMRSINIDLINIETNKPYIQKLLNFFRLRGKRL